LFLFDDFELYDNWNEYPDKKINVGAAKEKINLRNKE
jgi:hypothetical protein